MRHLRAHRYPLLLAGVLLLPALGTWASPPRRKPAEAQRAASTFHLFTDPLPPAPALPLENIPIGSSSDGGSPHFHLQSRMALKGDRLFVAFLDATLQSAAFTLSTDGGRSFSAQRASPIPGQIFGMPDAAFGIDGELLFASTPVSDGLPRLARSTDGGETFSQAYAVWNQMQAQDPRLAVDTGASSPYKGNIYLTAFDYPFDYYGGTVFSRSTDGGKTFNSPTLVDYVSDAPVVAPNGNVLIASMSWDNTASLFRASIRISSDGGGSFGPARFVSPPTLPASSVGMVAVDSYGMIHIAFEAAPPDSKSDRSDVFYVRSTDGGVSFSEPRRLNDDGGTASQTGPSIAAGPGGLLAVKWFDRRNDSASDTLNDVYMAISTDGGLSFGRNLRVTDHSWPGGPPDAGSLLADLANFYLSWTDLRSGNEEIFYSYVPVNQPTDTPDFSISPLNSYDVVLAGRTARLDLLTSAINGYSGDLKLTASGPPGGPAIAFDSGSVRAGDGATLQVAASRDTVPGTYLVTVTAEGQGKKRSTDLRINVHDPDRKATLPLEISSKRGVAQAISRPVIDRRGVITVAYSDDSKSVGKPLSYFRRSYDRGRTYTGPVETSLSLRAFTVDPDGGLYALYEEGGDLFVSRSTDGGTTFISTVALTDSHGGSTLVNAAIAVDGNGHVAAAWMDQSVNFSQTFNVVQSSDAARTFGPSVRLEGPDRNLWIGSFDVAIDSKGTEFVCYAKSSSRGQTARLAVAPAGQPFGAARDISLGSVSFTSLSLGNDNVIYVASMDGSGRTRIVTSSDSGLSFGIPVDLYEIHTNLSAPFVVSDHANGVTVAWSAVGAGLDSADVLYRRSTDGGRTFGSTENLSTNPGYSWNPLGAADAYGNVLILWNDYSPGRQHVLASWIPPTQTFDVPPSAFILEPSVDPQIEVTSSVSFAGAGIGPDLTAAFTYEWDFGDGTTGSGEHVTHVFAVPGVHTVVLTVIDSAGRRGTASRLIAVRVPVEAASDTDLVLPVVTDARGVGASHYTTELTLVSRASRPVTALLQYTAAVGSGSGYASVTLAPGEERMIPDAIVFLRSRGLPIPGDGSSQIGTLRVVFPGAAPGEVFLGGRTSTPGGSGTYGLFYPSAAMSESTLAVIGLQENDALRSNLALLNTGDSEVTLRVQLLGANGEDLGLLPDQSLDPLGWTQLNRPLKGLANAGRAVVTRVAGASTFSAYGVLLDNVTSDGSFIPPLPAGISASDRLIPVVLDAGGVNAAHYTTELTLANLSAGPLELSCTYTAAFGTGSGTVRTTLSAGQQLVVPNAVAFLRAGGLAIPSDGQDVAGSLMVAAGSAGFAAGARTFSHAPTGAGTYGVYYSGLTSEESAASTAFVYGLQQNAAQRSSLAVVNRGDAGDAVNLSLSYFDAHGSSLGDPVPVRLVPGEWRQFNQPLGTRGASSGYVRVERVSGSSRFVAYGVLNDNATSDGSYIPMTR